jgi:c-di-GMP-related signal transduction protein
MINTIRIALTRAQLNEGLHINYYKAIIEQYMQVGSISKIENTEDEAIPAFLRVVGEVDGEIEAMVHFDIYRKHMTFNEMVKEYGANISTIESE